MVYSQIVKNKSKKVENVAKFQVVFTKKVVYTFRKELIHVEIGEWIKDVKNIEKIKERNKELEEKYTELGIDKIDQADKMLEEKNRELEGKQKEIEENIEILNRCSNKINQLNDEIESLNAKAELKEKQVQSSINQISKNKELYKSMEHSVNSYLNGYVNLDNYKLNSFTEGEIEELAPTVMVKLNAMNINDLKRAYRDNEKQIDKLLDLYSSRYTTKANKAIYDLMVIALRAEVQNIMIDMKYNKLDISIERLKEITTKYLKIAGEGNQSILPTLTKFIGQVEYLFINAIKIEYNYYVKKEQAKQEQLAIREQMRQEAEERKALDLEKKKVEKEEEKYKIELDKVNEMLSNSIEEKETEKLRKKIIELQAKLSEVTIKKEEIINLQNGKAGTVYVISNIGAFGKDVFKIGMTRRLDPQDRVNELGSASVPFKFDVHSFIFSEDAVALESKLHEILNDKRVNKVNRRKEFFNVSIEELEKIVRDIDPTAEFSMTAAAEEYRESLSSDITYTDNLAVYNYDEEDD